MSAVVPLLEAAERAARAEYEREANAPGSTGRSLVWHWTQVELARQLADAERLHRWRLMARRVLPDSVCE